MKEFYPEAKESAIQKICGIKWPGNPATDAALVTADKHGKKTTEDTSSPKKTNLPWPENLLRAMEESAANGVASRAEKEAALIAAGVEESAAQRDEYGEAAAPVFALSLPDHLSPDQLEGLSYALTLLKDNEQEAIRLRYQEQKTLKEAGDAVGLSKERIRQLCAKGIRKLRYPTRLMFITLGYQGSWNNKQKRIEIVKVLPRPEQIAELKIISVYECGLSVRGSNCLGRNGGLLTLGDVVESMDEDPLNILRIRNLGRGSLLEVVEKLEEYGVDCHKGREAYGFGKKRK